MSAATATAEFERLYEEKTSNRFEQASAEFVKYPNKFYPLELDYGQDDEDLTSKMAEAGSKSTLPLPVQELVRMIFDVETMRRAMMEFEVCACACVRGYVRAYVCAYVCACVCVCVYSCMVFVMCVVTLI